MENNDVKCGGENSLGGCGKDIPLSDAYRCSDCEQYFHRDCLRQHCEYSSYITAIRANKELCDGWKKEVAAAITRAESAERENAELRRAATSPAPDSCLVPREKQPLKCRIDGGVLCISIGVNTLKFAAENHEDFFDGDKNTLEVTDAALFAKEVLREIDREAEDGTTPVHLMLDRAIFEAVENGPEGARLTK